MITVVVVRAKKMIVGDRNVGPEGRKGACISFPLSSRVGNLVEAGNFEEICNLGSWFELGWDGMGRRGEQRGVRGGAGRVGLAGAGGRGIDGIEVGRGIDTHASATITWTRAFLKPAWSAFPS